ncbi:MAG TPA: 4Fe-4S dicluster domain-containing protein [Xanthomonadales bacterium]|nr:4Fe-4S dicluster domain-containing protein [Xanthomonadales bacterium]
MGKKHADYQPKPIFLDAFPPVSGNTVNGLGETEKRRPSPFFWHPPDRQTHGVLQETVVSYHRQSPEMREVFNPAADRGPKPVRRAEQKVEMSAEDWTARVKEFVLGNEGDLVGIVPMKDDYVYQGYEVHEANVILIGVSMDYEELSKAPASFDQPDAGVEVGRQYNRASRVARRLVNYILEQGHQARGWPGPYASALSMMPAAIDAGLGELGKHGSLINREYGSAFRLAAVTTDLPLNYDQADDFGAEDFCTRCQVCVNACPPGAIENEKQMVRGIEKWYVDFDACIPYFGETLACGICLAVCPWSKPGTAPSLSEKMLRRRARKAEKAQAAGDAGKPAVKD